MATLEFYMNLDNDFSIYEGEEELNGLTYSGFIGTEPLRIENFDKLALNAASDVIVSFLSPISKVNRKYDSQALKHFIVKILEKDTNYRINNVSNSTVILAMYDAGFRIQRIKGSPNCYFNISEKGIKRLYMRAYNLNT